MPFEDFARVLDEVKAHQPGVKTMVHTVGGEPLVRQDLLECGRRITEIEIPNRFPYAIFSTQEQ